MEYKTGYEDYEFSLIEIYDTLVDTIKRSFISSSENISDQWFIVNIREQFIEVCYYSRTGLAPKWRRLYSKEEASDVIAKCVISSCAGHKKLLRFLEESSKAYE